jgi:hypothetical protein
LKVIVTSIFGAFITTLGLSLIFDYLPYDLSNKLSPLDANNERSFFEIL